MKCHITTWEQFQHRVRHVSSPKKPAYVLFQEIVGQKQQEGTSTETFVAQKRMLFSQLPTPSHTEGQQIDIIYGQLHIKIKERVPRASINSFDELLEAARDVEMLL